MPETETTSRPTLTRRGILATAAIAAASRGELTVAPAMTLKLAQLLQGGAGGYDRRGMLAALTDR